MVIAKEKGVWMSVMETKQAVPTLRYSEVVMVEMVTLEEMAVLPGAQGPQEPKGEPGPADRPLTTYHAKS
jgi:hypothetical protein